MATIRSFRALRPRPDLADKVASVPYDVVNTEEALDLAKGNPYSFLHIVRPEIDLPSSTDLYDDTVYDKAAENFQSFIREGFLEEDPEPVLYIYRLVMNGREQVGIAGCCAVKEYENNTIKKHEHTRKAKEDDRLRHMLTLRAHAGPVLLTFHSTSEIKELMAKETSETALYDFTDADGVRHTLWRCRFSKELEAACSRVPALYIADGHHRAAGAMRVKEALFQREPEGEYNYFLTVTFPSDQMAIYPYNKYVSDLGGLSTLDFLATVEKSFYLDRSGRTEPAEKGSFCMYLDGQWYELKEKVPSPAADPVAALDLSKFQNKLLEPILGITDQRNDGRIDFAGGPGSPKKLENWVDTQGGVAFTFYPVEVEELMAVADAGLVMPPKSTWFAPKLRSGLLIHRF
ncbi:MAG: DUF1015 domain-containing protein [Spirochaetales bacterium]|nr:DUF1015 domain-containing protein [Spirochaetales bacterium]